MKMSDQLYAPAALPPPHPAKNFGTHWMVVWIVPRTALGVVEEKKILLPLSGLEHRIVQSTVHPLHQLCSLDSYFVTQHSLDF
jgi:hypothetical protein